MNSRTATRVLSFLLIAVCLLSLKAYAADTATASDLRFTILHTNDLHAHDEPFIERGRSVGGMAKIAHIIRSIKAKNPNTLALDAGDIFQGTSFFKHYQGAIEIEMLNRAGYDIYTIGNHEFDSGADNLLTHLKNARFDIINANMDTSGMPEMGALIKPSVIKTIDGQRIGFVGGILPSLTEISLTTGKLRIKETGANWKAPIDEEIARLKKQGVDKIVLVTHVGLELDRELAQNPDVDVIVGGHSHTRLDKAIVVPHADGSSAIIVQTGSYGRWLGKLDVAFDSKGRVNLKNTQYRLIKIDDRVPSDSDIAEYLEEKARPFEHLRNTVVGIANGAFDNQFKRYPYDSPIGNLVADALADAAKKQGATIAMQNRGGIRGHIDQGIITQERIEEILPFENHLMVATVDGGDILKALENSVSGFLGGRFLDVHGMKFAYNPNKPVGQRIIYAQAADTSGKWGKVEPGKHYRIAINDYSFRGGEGYDFSRATDVVDTGKRLSVYLQDYLLKQKLVKPRSSSRIIPVLDGAPAQKQDRRQARTARGARS